MSQREIEFLYKFWCLPGGPTIVTELLLGMIHRRILALHKLKSTHLNDLTRDQLLQCNASILNLTQIGYAFRSFLLDKPSEREIVLKMTELIVNYKNTVRYTGLRLRGVCGFEPADGETTRSLIAILSKGEGASYIVNWAIEMITSYVCYLEVVIVIVATIEHEDKPIPLNMHVLWNLISELRSIIYNLMKMDNVAEQLCALQKVTSSPLYVAIRKLHYLIETFSQNQQLLQPSAASGQSLLRMMLEGGSKGNSETSGDTESDGAK